MRVLVIEDNLAIVTNLSDYLQAHGHTVESARDGARGFRLASSQEFDAVVLDLSLPKMDGITLCRKIRTEVYAETPILLLTARDTLKDKLTGFDSGADDYLVKPFDLEEVEARLLAMHRRHAGKRRGRILQVGNIMFDAGRKSVRVGGADVKLPPKCMRLLETFMSEPSRLFSRRQLEIALWGSEQETSDRLRNHIHVLRRALVRAGSPDPIETVHGLGFRMAQPE